MKIGTRSSPTIERAGRGGAKKVGGRGGTTNLDRCLGRVEELELQGGLLAGSNHGLAQLDCASPSLGPVVGHDGGEGTGG